MIGGAIALASCLLAGDSIAKGIGPHLPECVVTAKTGTPTSMMPAMIPNREWDSAILSAGSNDARAPDLVVRMVRLRKTVRARHVVWILPYDRRAASVVSVVARHNHDLVIDLARFPSKDGIHPSDYGAIATSLRR